MILLCVSVGILVLGVLLLCLASLRLKLARECEESLSGRWGWRFGMTVDGNVAIVLVLWPNGKRDESALLAAQEYTVVLDKQERPIQYHKLGEGSITPLKFFQIVFTTTPYRSVVPSGG